MAQDNQELRLSFYGVRGSIPSPGPDTVVYGGNTACLLLETGTDRIIIDAGTGIRRLGEDLEASLSPGDTLHLFVTHTHWDHIQGLPFFSPIHIPNLTIEVYGPARYANTLHKIISGQMKSVYFPVDFTDLRAKFHFHPLGEQTFTLDHLQVTTRHLNHPIRTLGYRFSHFGKTVVTCYDHEPYAKRVHNSAPGKDHEESPEQLRRGLLHFLHQADLAVYDTQFTDKDFKPGWGHSTVNSAIDNCLAAGVKHVVLFHHAPSRMDKELDVILDHARRYVKAQTGSLQISLAQEGGSLTV